MTDTDRHAVVTPDLLARYNQPGPRYTSYPTAPEFSTEFGPDSYRERLVRANRVAGEPLSLYVHLPFCEHRCHFCGCHVVITQREDVVRKYLDYLKREIDAVAALLPDRREVLQLHWGGGTPTHLSPAELREIHGHIAATFRLRPDAELAIEVDPRVTGTEHVDTLVDLGFNRFSMGVQDFTPEVQVAIDRNQTYDETADIVRHCRSLGVRGINIDLIYGLPRQTVESFTRNLGQVIGLGPDRLAVYSFAHVPWIRPHQRRIDDSELPDTETKFALFAAAVRTFTDAGYVQIGMDHFAKPDDEMAQALRGGYLTRNFMGYAVKTAPDLIAFGISGIGEVAGAYAQNVKKLSDYYREIDEGRLPVDRGYVLDEDDTIRNFVIRSIMCNLEIRVDRLRERFGIDYADYFAEEDRRLTEEIEPGFYERTDAGIRVTPLGQHFLRNICMVFDRYLTQRSKDKPLFSRTI